MHAETIDATPDVHPRTPEDSGEFSVRSFPLERPLLKGRRRDDHATEACLSHFVAGPENRLAAFVASEENDAFEFGNPILLVGPPGSGKSSLALHLAARASHRRHDVVESGVPRAMTVLLPLVDFARRYADAVDNDDLLTLREELDAVEVLVLDDLQAIQGKQAAQSELAMRIEARCAARMPTVLTCHRLPSEVRGIRPALVSRCLAGLTVSLQPPGPEARKLLLSELALLHQVEVESSLLSVLEGGLESDLPVRQLDAAVKHLGLWSRMNDSPPSIEAIQATLDQVGRKSEVSLVDITTATARYFRLRSAELKSNSRRQQLVRARSLAMYLARRLTGNSLQQIGEHFGGRDHSTVLHAIRKVESMIEEDTDTRRAADDIQDRLVG